MRIPALTAALPALAFGATLALAPPAKADGFDPSAVVQVDGWRHHHHGRHWGPPPGQWRGYYPPPRAYYAPPPRYYYPPPRVYYPPPPRYYAPQPGVGVYLRF